MNTKLGPYNLIGTIGRGGMGVVYKGFETSLNRFVAIKMLADALVNDAGVRERFVREARSMAALNDPHIIQIYSVGEDNGCPYFIMEFVDGESLSSLLTREGQLHAEQAAKVVYQTAQGLAVAHDKGVIHRDIKPGNLMITSRGSVKIADFGIALSHQDMSRKLTTSGEFVGTPGYLSPEVCLAKPVDQRSDIFALGIVLFEMLTGKMPFTDESPLGLMLEVVKADIPDVRALNAEVDPELSRILSKMIAKEPADRYQTCHELAADLAKHPMLAKGGALGLKPMPTALEPIRRSATSAGIGALAPVVADNAADTPTARRPNRLAASTPLARRPAAVTPASKRYWAVGAAAALVVAASAWALRDELPLPAALRSSPAASADSLSLAELTSGSTATPDTAAFASNSGNTGIAPAPRRSSAATVATDPDAALMDALWLDDVPDEALVPDAGDGSGPAGYSDAGAQIYAGPAAYQYPAYAYASPLLLPAPVTYYAPAPWHFSVGFGIGIGYWATRVIAPYPVYYGPVLRPAYGWARPLPGSSVPAPGFAGPINFARPPLPTTVSNGMRGAPAIAARGGGGAVAPIAARTSANALPSNRAVASIPRAAPAHANLVTSRTAPGAVGNGAANSGFVHNAQNRENFRSQNPAIATSQSMPHAQARPTPAMRNAQRVAFVKAQAQARAQAKAEARARARAARAQHPVRHPPPERERHPRRD